MNHFEVDIIPSWPKMKLIIHTPRGVITHESMYDTALVNFEVQVRNVLQQQVNDLIRRRKEGNL